jgi:hypothetical protein
MKSQWHSFTICKQAYRKLFKQFIELLPQRSTLTQRSVFTAQRAPSNVILSFEIISMLLELTEFDFNSVGVRTLERFSSFPYRPIWADFRRATNPP